MVIYMTLIFGIHFLHPVFGAETGEILKIQKQDSVSIAFASCYDDRFNYKSLFRYINEDKPEVFIWHGDFAYISRTKRKNYFKLLQNPFSNFPEIFFDQLLGFKSKIKSVYDRIVCDSGILNL